MTSTINQGYNLIRKHIKLEGLLRHTEVENAYDLEKLPKKKMIRDTLSLAIDKYALSQTKIKHIDLKSVTVSEFGKIRSVLSQDNNEIFWSEALEEYPESITPAFFKYRNFRETLKKAQLRNILKLNHVLFKYGTPEEFQELTDTLTAKEMASAFYMSSCRQTTRTRYTWNRWYSDKYTAYVEPGYINVKINSDLASWFEQEVFLTSLDGSTTVSTPMNKNLKFMKTRII